MNRYLDSESLIVGAVRPNKLIDPSFTRSHCLIAGFSGLQSIHTVLGVLDERYYCTRPSGIGVTLGIALVALFVAMIPSHHDSWQQ